MLALVLLGRPLFLAGGFLLHALGVVIALVEGAGLNLPALLWGQLAITSVQWMTHYSNEYFDLPADRANVTPTRWAGGSRMLPAGRLRPAAALLVAALLGVLGLAAGLVITVHLRPGPLVLPFMLLAMALALGYSAPPLRLHSRGLGELTVALVVAGLTPVLGYYLQAGRLTAMPFLAALPLFPLQFAMMLVLELPDAAGDAAAGKRTLVVRFGPAGAARLHALVLVVAYLALPASLWLGLPPLVAAGAALSAPLALWHGWRVAHSADFGRQRWNSLGFWAIALFMGTAAAETLAYLWLFLLA